MKYRIIFSLLFIAILFTNKSVSQDEGGLSFLTNPPYTEMNGMGTASVANFTSDPLSVMTNPAHLGMFSQDQYFSLGYNHTAWFPEIQQPDLWYHSFAFNVGLPLKKLNENALPLSFGFGYSSVYQNWGNFVITQNSPDPIGSFNANEKSLQYTFSVGVDYWVKASLGYTYKHITSSLAPFDIQGQGREGVATANAYDLGLLVDVPVIDIISKLQDKPMVIYPNTTPFFDLNIGIAQNNLGTSSVTYIDPAEADPLPRTARAGIGINLGINYTKEDVTIKPISFKWTIEASEELVKRNPTTYDTTFDGEGNVQSIQDVPGNWQYESGLGDIKFLDEVVLGNGNKQTMKAKGWEVNFIEVFFLRGGRFEEDASVGGRTFSTTGWGLRFSGLIKCLRILDIAPDNNTIPGMILNHIDFRYDHSSWTTDDPLSPLAGTKFNSIMFNVLL